MQQHTLLFTPVILANFLCTLARDKLELGAKQKTLSSLMNLESIGADIATTVRILNGILTSICQLLALFVISIGITRSLIIYLKDWLFNPQSTEAFQRSRLAMGYSFSLGLSFLVGSSILKTMISSRWDDIARLVAIIAVRTVLNYLLMQAIHSTTETQNSQLPVPITNAVTSSGNSH